MAFDFLRHLRALYAPRVQVLIYAPDKEAQPLYQAMGWNDPFTFCEQYVQTVRRLSGGRLIFQVDRARAIIVPDFPPLEGGSKYTVASWEAARANDALALRDGPGYAMVDYAAALNQFNLPALIDQKKIDEVWIFGGPLFGLYESRMVGRSAIWCNAPPLNLPCRNFVVMGFSYERGEREMLHDLGHRAESLVNMRAPTDYQNWVTSHGTVHFAPGSKVEYSNDEYQWLGALLPKWWEYVARV